MSWIDPLLLPKSESTEEELLSSVTTSTAIIGSSKIVLADFSNYTEQNQYQNIIIKINYITHTF